MSNTSEKSSRTYSTCPHRTTPNSTARRPSTLTNEVQATTDGNEPRPFLLDERSGYLLIGHQESDTITVFKPDTDNETLTATDNQITVPAPVCLLMQ